MDSPSLSRDISTHEAHSTRSGFKEDNEKDNDNEMDVRNPQNWSSTRKTLLFVALMSSSLLADG